MDNGPGADVVPVDRLGASVVFQIVIWDHCNRTVGSVDGSRGCAGSSLGDHLGCGYCGITDADVG